MSTSIVEQGAQLCCVDYLRTLTPDQLADAARQFERDKTLAAFRKGRVFFVARDTIGRGELDAWFDKEGFKRTTAYEDLKLYLEALARHDGDAAAETALKDLPVTQTKIAYGAKKESKSKPNRAVVVRPDNRVLAVRLVVLDHPEGKIGRGTNSN
jgi:hypothetical protein